MSVGYDGRATSRPTPKTYKEDGRQACSQEGDGNFSSLIKDSKPNTRGVVSISRPKTNQQNSSQNRYSYKKMLYEAGS